MIEPRRLLEEGATDFERTLLGSWKHEKPRAAARARVLGAAGVGVGAAGALAAKNAGASATSGLALAKWLAVGAAVIGATTATGIAARNDRLRAQESGASAVTAQNAAARLPPPARPSSDGVLASANDPSANVAPAPAARVTGSAAPGRGPVRFSPKRERDTLGREVAMIDKGHAALRAGDAARALAIARDYQSTYPHGVFEQEADVLRVKALIHVGDMAGATNAADSFATAHPTSPHVAHVRALVRDDSIAEPATSRP